MKVRIGKYTYRWVSQVHDRHMDLKYDSWSESLDWEDRLWEKLESFLQTLYNKTINIYLDRKQRKIKVKIHSYDTWDAGHTLALIILPMLKKLKDVKRGSPYVDDEDVPEHLRSTSAPALSQQEKDTGHVDNNHHARWEWVINEMIFAFENKVNDDWEDKFTTGEIDIKFEKTDKGLYQLVHGPNHTYKVEREAKKAYYARITNGYRLFGKYYDALWH